MPDPGWWHTLWPNPEGVIRSLGIRSSMTVVDLCCGDGYFTAPLAAFVKGKLYAVDLDRAMLEKAQAEVEHVGASVRQWICADARDLAKLVPEAVDFVMIANTFHGVPDKAAMARSVAAALTPGGRLGIVNWHQLPLEETVILGQPRGPKTEMRMSPEQVKNIVEPVGFELEKIVQFPPFHYGAVFRRKEDSDEHIT
ncbi:methyltransferase domain-containing protein [Halomonas urmiana]|uniref:Methyltransferase domain-containing protein n=2 Tax=Halomonas urmiana TaxID=490901 RepID=A0A5R8MJH1_9GAMM|nr:class I SAM-dependent methyltransferase [Halomonas urmiana]TLF52157.1 methyltransferase domain-containing protein [Halomonas urmiana]